MTSKTENKMNSRTVYYIELFKNGSWTRHGEITDWYHTERAAKRNATLLTKMADHYGAPTRIVTGTW